MCEGGYASPAVDVNSDVPLVGHGWGAGVEPHPHADRTGLERRGRAGRRGERDEEGVALRVDLYASVEVERLTQDTAVRGERVCVAVRSERMQQRRRALYVSKEEGDRAGGEIRAHR